MFAFPIFSDRLRFTGGTVSYGQRQEALRVGLYGRVSTHDQQTLSLQMRAMHEYAAKRGWTIAAQIKEVGSGATERELRRATRDHWCSSTSPSRASVS